MIPDENTLRALRDALAVSPDNVPLRRHLADTLRSIGRHEEAEKEYRRALQTAGDDLDLKLALAGCYFESGKDSHALVILESLLLREEVPASAHLLRARLLARKGEIGDARRAYERAIAADARLADPELEAALGGRVPASPVKASSGAEESEDETEPSDHEPEGAHSSAPVDAERPKVTFADVGGMQSVKDEIAIKIIQPMKNPELFRAYGKGIGGGILMYGPPGCGKTHLARATAGEVKARFFAVGIHDVLEMWIGSSERNLHAIFEEARRTSPSVLFFDEVDALGSRRTDVVKSAMRQVVNQFLSELDGAKTSNEGLLILAATNAPWHLDPALRRPGRFDRILFVPPPDEEARAAILRLHLRGKPQGSIDFAKIAAKTNGLSGADLRAVVEQAVERKLRQALASGRPEPVQEKDLLEAARGVSPSTREWFATAKNHALFANQGGIYDDVAKYLNL